MFNLYGKINKKHTTLRNMQSIARFFASFCVYTVFSVIGSKNSRMASKYSSILEGKQRP